jgi:hypothetical protein
VSDGNAGIIGGWLDRIRHGTGDRVMKFRVSQFAAPKPVVADAVTDQVEAGRREAGTRTDGGPWFVGSIKSIAAGHMSVGKNRENSPEYFRNF